MLGGIPFKYMKTMSGKVKLLVGMFMVASCAMASGANTPDQIRQYMDGVRQGSLPATMLMADAYQHGDGVTRNLARARQYFEVVAKAGDPVAQTILATMYSKGEGGPKDISRTIYWLRQSAMQNHPDALLALALRFKDGDGVKEDGQAAYNLMVRCAIHPVSEGKSIDPTPLACRFFIGDLELRQVKANNDQVALRKAMLFLALAFDDPNAARAQRGDADYARMLQAARKEYDQDQQYLTPESQQYIKDNLANRQTLFDGVAKSLDIPKILQR